MSPVENSFQNKFLQVPLITKSICVLCKLTHHARKRTITNVEDVPDASKFPRELTLKRSYHITL